jgi:hypothetical protein
MMPVQGDPSWQPHIIQEPGIGLFCVFSIESGHKDDDDGVGDPPLTKPAN